MKKISTMSVVRQKLGWTQSELAREVKIDQSMLSQIERYILPMREGFAPKLAKILRLTEDELLMDYDEYVLKHREDRVGN